MKTTIDIADNILARSRQVAREEGITLRELVEEGLGLVTERRVQEVSRKVHPVTFKGKGLSPQFANVPWSRIRESSYEGRGS